MNKKWYWKAKQINNIFTKTSKKVYHTSQNKIITTVTTLAKVWTTETTWLNNKFFSPSILLIKVDVGMWMWNY